MTVVATTADMSTAMATGVGEPIMSNDLATLRDPIADIEQEDREPHARVPPDLKGLSAVSQRFDQL